MENSQKLIHLLKIQSELKAPKGQKNAFGNYSYRSAEDILNAVKPLCIKYGVIILLNDRIEFIEGRHYLVATAQAFDVESGELLYSVEGWAREEDHRAKMDDAQLTGACSSYARKYALCGLLAISQGNDFDAMDNTKQGVSTITKIHGAKSITELTKIWEELDAAEQTNLKQVFTTRKIELEK